MSDRLQALGRSRGNIRARAGGTVHQVHTKPKKKIESRSDTKTVGSEPADGTLRSKRLKSKHTPWKKS